jgi:hypothetical protein
VASAAAQFGFAHATAGLAIAGLNDVPMLIVRTGADTMPGLNVSLDRFVAGALAANLPISTINYPAGLHAFDIAEDSAITRRVIREILEYLAIRLALESIDQRRIQVVS